MVSFITKLVNKVLGLSTSTNEHMSSYFTAEHGNPSKQYRRELQTDTLFAVRPVQDSPFRYKTARPEFTKDQLEVLTIDQITQLQAILGYNHRSNAYIHVDYVHWKNAPDLNERVKSFLDDQRQFACGETMRRYGIPAPTERIRPGGIVIINSKFWNALYQRGYAIDNTNNHTQVDTFFAGQSQVMGPAPVWNPLDVIQCGQLRLRQHRSKDHWTQDELEELTAEEILEEMRRRRYTIWGSSTKYGLVESFLNQQRREAE